MCLFQPTAETAEIQPTHDDDWLEFWMALLALELADPETADVR
jgi:hypothetical protein